MKNYAKTLKERRKKEQEKLVNRRKINNKLNRKSTVKFEESKEKNDVKIKDDLQKLDEFVSKVNGTYYDDNQNNNNDNKEGIFDEILTDLSNSLSQDNYIEEDEDDYKYYFENKRKYFDDPYGLDVSDVHNFVLLIVLIGMVLGVVIIVLNNFSTSIGIDATAQTAINSTRDSLTPITLTWIPLIVTVAVIGIITSMIFRSFGRIY